MCVHAVANDVVLVGLISGQLQAYSVHSRLAACIMSSNSFASYLRYYTYFCSKQCKKLHAFVINHEWATLTICNTFIVLVRNLHIFTVSALYVGVCPYQMWFYPSLLTGIWSTWEQQMGSCTSYKKEKSHPTKLE